MTLQDRIELLTTARDLLDETISLLEGATVQLSNFAVCTKGEALNLDRTFELIDEMRARRDGIQAKISTLNDQIENEAEPGEQQMPVIIYY